MLRHHFLLDQQVLLELLLLILGLFINWLVSPCSVVKEDKVFDQLLLGWLNLLPW